MCRSHMVADHKRIQSNGFDPPTWRRDDVNAYGLLYIKGIV